MDAGKVAEVLHNLALESHSSRARAGDGAHRTAFRGCLAEGCDTAKKFVAELRAEALRAEAAKVDVRSSGNSDPRIPAALVFQGEPPIVPLSVRGDRVVDATGRDLCAALPRQEVLPADGGVMVRRNGELEWQSAPNAADASTVATLEAMLPAIKPWVKEQLQAAVHTAVEGAPKLTPTFGKVEGFCVAPGCAKPAVGAVLPCCAEHGGVAPSGLTGRSA